MTMTVTMQEEQDTKPLLTCCKSLKYLLNFLYMYLHFFLWLKYYFILKQNKYVHYVGNIQKLQNVTLLGITLIMKMSLKIHGLWFSIIV